MKDIAARRERFMQDDESRRLGAIAANLARIVSFAENPANRQAVFDLIQESKWFIEWAAPTIKPDTAEHLVSIQVELALLERRLQSMAVELSSLVGTVAGWRDEVLDMSGLLS